LFAAVGLTAFGCGVDALPEDSATRPATRRQTLSECVGGCLYTGDKSEWISCENPCVEDEKEESASAR
jgi:hypothetical protein